MKTQYNHATHSYDYKPTGHAAVDRLGNMRGVHNDTIANAQPAGLFVWVVPAFVILALLFKVDAVAEPRPAPVFDLQDSAFICVMGVCL